jgi:hypothetical protein
MNGHELTRTPDWVGETRAALRSEAGSYLRTFSGFLRSPQRFVHEWAGGTRDAMNPLGFLATSVVLLGAVRAAGWNALANHPTRPSPLAAHFIDKPLWAEVWSALGPTLHFAALGLICHFTLRLLGSRNVQASASAALTFYSAGAPGALAEVLVWLVMLPLILGGVLTATEPAYLLFPGFGLALAAFCSYLGYSLGAYHRPKWWHMLIAFLAAFVLTGLFFGYVNPPGDYGLRWYLQIWRDGRPTFLLRLAL